MVRAKKIYKNSQGVIIEERVMTFTEAEYAYLVKHPEIHDGAIFERMPTKVTKAEETDLFEKEGTIKAGTMNAKPKDQLVEVKIDATETISDIKEAVEEAKAGKITVEEAKEKAKEASKKVKVTVKPKK